MKDGGGGTRWHRSRETCRTAGALESPGQKAPSSNLQKRKKQYAEKKRKEKVVKKEKKNTGLSCSSRHPRRVALHTRGCPPFHFHHHLIPSPQPSSPARPPPRASPSVRSLPGCRDLPMFRAHAPLLHLLAGGGGGRRSPQRLPALPRRHSRERPLTFAVSHHDV